MLLIFSRNEMPFWMGFFLPNIFLMSASSLSLMAQCRFYEQPIPKKLIGLLWAIGLTGLLGFFLLDWAVAWAMASVCFTMGTQLFASMVTIVRHARKPRPLAGVFLAVTLGFMSAGYWARFVWALFHLDTPVAPISLAGAHQSALVLGALFVVSSFRIEDNPCRYGGEEFCVLLPDTPVEVAHAKAQELVTRFEREHIRLGSGLSIGVTISVGVNDNRDGRNLLRTIQGADDALYEAKRNGRNQARLATL